MLKIKENVDLKELEKFGFRPISYTDSLCWFWTKEDVSIDNKTRIISLPCNDNFDYEPDKCLDIIFDLNEANLVEKELIKNEKDN